MVVAGKYVVVSAALVVVAGAFVVVAGALDVVAGAFLVVTFDVVTGAFVVVAGAFDVVTGAKFPLVSICLLGVQWQVQFPTSASVMVSLIIHMDMSDVV